MQIKNLSRPPITAAVLEVRFNPNKDITLAKLQELSNDVSSDEGKVGVITAGKFSFSLSSDGGGQVQDLENQKKGYSVINASESVSYSFELDKIVVRYQNGFYEKWPSLLEDLQSILPKYLNYAPQTEITRVGMRYVNELTLGINNGQSMATFVTSPIPMPQGQGIPISFNHFRSEVSIPYDSVSFAKIIQGCNGAKKIEGSDQVALSYLLDIDVWNSVSLGPRDESALIAEFEQLRNKRNIIFFASVTEEALKPYE